jgi:hypothetical protein
MISQSLTRRQYAAVHQNSPRGQKDLELHVDQTPLFEEVQRVQAVLFGNTWMYLEQDDKSDEKNASDYI